MAIRITIIEDHPLLINALLQVFQRYPDLEVVGVCQEAQCLLTGLKVVQPDVLLFDMAMSGNRGLELLAILTHKYPDMRILVFVNREQEYYLGTLVEYQVKGFISRDSDEQHLVAAIRAIYEEGEYIDKGIWESLRKVRRRKKQKSLLTKREKQVLKLIADSHSSEAIAKKLFVSKRTVDNHRHNLLAKLQVKNSASLIKRAIQLGLINPAADGD